MTKSTTPAAPETALATVERQTILAQVKALIQQVGWAEQDPTERMVEYILGHDASEWEQLFEKLPNFQNNPGEKITVRSFRLAESDYPGGLGVYLILDVDPSDAFPRGLVNCSSQVSMVQLLKTWKDGKLPAVFEIVRKEKQTKSGFHPIHLRYLGAA
jgi:hypothetical protein